MARTYYIWDEVNDTLLMEKDEAGNTTAVYTYEPDQYGPLISQCRNGQTRYHHFDGQDSTRQLSDAGRNVTDSSIYTAFGETVTSSGTTANPYGYKGAVGYYANHDTNDLYVRGRMYRPQLARWLSAAPTDRFVAALEYALAGKSPIVLSDAAGVGGVDGGGFTLPSRRLKITPESKGCLACSGTFVNWRIESSRPGTKLAIVQRITAARFFSICRDVCPERCELDFKSRVACFYSIYEYLDAMPDNWGLDIPPAGVAGHRQDCMSVGALIVFAEVRGFEDLKEVAETKWDSSGVVGEGPCATSVSKYLRDRPTWWEKASEVGFSGLSSGWFCCNSVLQYMAYFSTSTPFTREHCRKGWFED